MKVLVTRLLPPQAQKRLEMLKCSGKIQLTQWNSMTEPIPRKMLLKELYDSHGLLCLLTDKINKEALDCGPTLKYVSSMSVGLDHIDLEGCKCRNIGVGNTLGVLTDCTADLTVGLLLATLRKFNTAIDAVKTDHAWGPWNPTQFCGYKLAGKSIGIVGMGQIGHAVVERLIPFKAGPFYYTTGSGNAKTTLFEAEHVISLDELLAKSDIVIATCALTPQTKGMFALAQFRKMKRNSVFINVSRGTIVNQDDLVIALKEGSIMLAGLDVTDPEPLDVASELLKMPDKVLVLPHIGSATFETREAMASLSINNLLAGLNIIE